MLLAAKCCRRLETTNTGASRKYHAELEMFVRSKHNDAERRHLALFIAVDRRLLRLRSLADVASTSRLDGILALEFGCFRRRLWHATPVWCLKVRTTLSIDMRGVIV